MTTEAGSEAVRLLRTAVIESHDAYEVEIRSKFAARLDALCELERAEARVEEHVSAHCASTRCGAYLNLTARRDRLRAKALERSEAT